MDYLLVLRDTPQRDATALFESTQKDLLSMHLLRTDIQLTAGHWNRSGTFVSDNDHNRLPQPATGGLWSALQVSTACLWNRRARLA